MKEGWSSTSLISHHSITLPVTPLLINLTPILLAKTQNMHMLNQGALQTRGCHCITEGINRGQTVRSSNAGVLRLDLRSNDQELRRARRHDLVQYLLKQLISCFISFLVSNLQELK